MIQNAIAAASIVGLVSFGITYLLMPPVRNYAIHKGWLDRPDGKRKIHTQSTPRVGGVAIGFGLSGGMLVMILLGAFSTGINMVVIIAMFVGMGVIILTGVMDDLQQIRARYKMLGQAMATLPLLFCNDLLVPVGHLLGGSTPAMMLAYPLVFGWALFIMNAVNLLDGLDGLAGGISLLSFIFLAAIVGIQGSVFLFTVAVCGALVAFLRYNIYRAKVFLGDSGSLLLGYLLAVLALVTLSSHPAANTFMSILVILGVPILDTWMTIARRVVRKRDPFAPDCEHLHHRVLRRTFGHQFRATIFFYVIGGLLGFVGLLIAQSGFWDSILLTAVSGTMGLILLWELDYFDRSSYLLASHNVSIIPGKEVPLRHRLNSTSPKQQYHRGPIGHFPPKR